MPISEKLRRMLDENIARAERNRRTFDIKKAHQQKDYALVRDLNEQMRRYNEQVEALNRQANRNPVTFFPKGDRVLAPEYRERIMNGEHPYDIIEELDAGPGGIYEQPRMKAVRDSLRNDIRHWEDFDVRRDMPRVRENPMIPVTKSEAPYRLKDLMKRAQGIADYNRNAVMKDYEIINKERAAQGLRPFSPPKDINRFYENGPMMIADPALHEKYIRNHPIMPQADFDEAMMHRTYLLRLQEMNRMPDEYLSQIASGKGSAGEVGMAREILARRQNEGMSIPDIRGEDLYGIGEVERGIYPNIDEDAIRRYKQKQYLQSIGMSNEEIYRRLGF